MSRRQSAPRLEFEAAAIYEYPEHLRPWLEELPKQPGVYIFHGESDTLPLYIGKSVNIRSRVLSHLRHAPSVATHQLVSDRGRDGGALTGSPVN